MRDVCDTCMRMCMTHVRMRVCVRVRARVRERLINGLEHPFRIEVNPLI